MAEKNILKENIINILGIENASDDDKAEILEKASNIVQKKVLMRVMDKLSDETKDELLTALDEGNQKRVQNKLDEHIDNLEDIVQEEVASIKEDLQDVIKG